MSVKGEVIQKTHREYTRNLAEGLEKLHRVAGAVAGAMRKRPRRLQRKGNSLSRLVTLTRYPLNAYWTSMPWVWRTSSLYRRMASCMASAA